MQKVILLVLFFTFILSAPILAQQPVQTITLKDGTSIKGQLINIADGSYTIASETMGQIKVPASQVLNINASTADHTIPITTKSDGSLSTESINLVKNNILEDPQIMTLIQDLIKDPAIAEILKNPSLLQDALSMDPQRIENNADMQKLMQNPTMKEILRAAAQKLQSPSVK